MTTTDTPPTNIPPDPVPQTTAITAPAPPADEKKISTRPARPAPYEGDALNCFASESNFDGAQRMAVALAASTLVPLAYQNNVPNCLIAIEAASRIRTSVLTVMQNLDVIYNRPAWRSTFLIATVNAGRRFTPLRFKWFGEMNNARDMNWGCRAVAYDRETGEECTGALITIGMAHLEGWWERKGSKWPTIPEQMLMYRAASFWTRIFNPEGTLGMGTTDEADDMGPPAPSGPIAPVPGSDPGSQGRRMSLNMKSSAIDVSTTTARPTEPAATETRPAAPPDEEKENARAAEPTAEELAKMHPTEPEPTPAGAASQRTLSMRGGRR